LNCRRGALGSIPSSDRDMAASLPAWTSRASPNMTARPHNAPTFRLSGDHRGQSHGESTKNLVGVNRVTPACSPSV
jgi:hypothetical protein